MNPEAGRRPCVHVAIGFADPITTTILLHVVIGFADLVAILRHVVMGLLDMLLHVLIGFADLFLCVHSPPRIIAALHCICIYIHTHTHT